VPIIESLENCAFPPLMSNARSMSARRLRRTAVDLRFRYSSLSYVLGTMNRDQALAELNRRRAELVSVVEEVKEWTEYGKEGGDFSASHLTFTVVSVTERIGTPVDANTILIQVSIANAEEIGADGAGNADDGALGAYNINEDAKAVAESFSIVLDSKNVSLKVNCHRQYSVLTTAHEESVGGAEEDAGLSEQQSVKSVPYVAIFDVNLMWQDEPDSTTFTCELEATCNEEPSLILHVKASLDDCANMKAIKEKEAAQLQDSILELEDMLKNQSNDHSTSTGAGSNSPKAGKKQKKVKAPQAKGPSVMEIAAQLYKKRSFLFFSGAAALIYFYGEYASV